MPKIENEGQYNVRITTYKIKPTPKEDDARAFQILLYGETPDGYTAIGSMNWSKTVIGGGKHAGKECRQVTQETLSMLGVEDGFPPNLDAAIAEGMEACFVMKNDTYNGTTTLKVAFINPVTQLLAPDEVDWSALLDEATAKPKPAPKAKAVRRAVEAPAPAAATPADDAEGEPDGVPF